MFGGEILSYPQRSGIDTNKRKRIEMREKTRDDDNNNSSQVMILCVCGSLFCRFMLLKKKKTNLGINKLYLEKIENLYLVTIISSHPCERLVEPALIF